MDVKVLLVLVEETGLRIMVRDAVIVPTWFQEIDKTIDLLVRIILKTELSHFLSVRYHRLLIGQYVTHNALPVF